MRLIISIEAVYIRMCLHLACNMHESTGALGSNFTKQGIFTSNGKVRIRHS